MVTLVLNGGWELLEVAMVAKSLLRVGVGHLNRSLLLRRFRAATGEQDSYEKGYSHSGFPGGLRFGALCGLSGVAKARFSAVSRRDTMSASEYVALSGSTTATFDNADLDRSLTDQDRLLMAETILAWADLDTGISYLTLLVFGLEHDAGSILIGNMDLKTKVERIKVLHEHHGKTRGAESLSRLITGMREFSASRNTVAHRKCIGRLFSEPTRLVFLSAKHIKKEPGRFEMLCVDHSELIASAKFARDASAKIHTMIEAVEEPQSG